MDLSPEAEEKRKLLYSPFHDFRIESTNCLCHDDVSLFCIDINPEHSEFGSPLPRYEFEIMVNKSSSWRY